MTQKTVTATQLDIPSIIAAIGTSLSIPTIGSVKSVAVSSVNNAITITGSPITTSGTISITANSFSSSSPGVVPASGGGTSTFLRADGTWATPSGSGIGTVTSVAATGSTGLTIGGSPITSNGTLTFALGIELQGLSILNANGIVQRTGAGTYTSAALTSGQVTTALGFTPGHGTVTSVGVTSATNAISVSGSPITTNGTISITANAFTSTTPGVVPLSGGGTANFLRADGTWATPAGTTTPGGSSTQVQFNLSGALAGDPGFSYQGNTFQTLTLGTPTQGGALVGSPGAGPTSAGLFLALRGGIGGSTSGAGGSVTVQGGSCAGSGNGGNTIIVGGVASGGGTGGSLVFQTGNTSPTTRLTIDNTGTWLLGGVTAGITGQVLTSNGAGAVPSWNSITVSSLNGGNTGQIPFQSGPSTTSFSPGFLFTAISQTLNIGTASSPATIAAPAVGSGTGISVSVFAGNTAGAFGTGGSMQISSGSGTGTSGIGGDLILSSGNGTSTAGSVNIRAGALGGVTNGQIKFSTASTTRLAIDGTTGSWLLAGTNAGVSGQALLSQGPSAAPFWGSPIASPAGSTSQIQFNSSGSLAGDAGLAYVAGSNPTLTVGGGASGGTIQGAGIVGLRLSNGGSNGVISFILNGGNVFQIGVGGIWQIAGSTGNTGQSITSNGTGVVSWGTPSDVRMKDQIVDSSLGLDFVNKLRPVSYRWKEDGWDDGINHYGLIAQEVKALDSDYTLNGIVDKVKIRKDDTTQDRLGLNWNEITPVLIKAIQELSAELETLKKKMLD